MGAFICQVAGIFGLLATIAATFLSTRPSSLSDELTRNASVTLTALFAVSLALMVSGAIMLLRDLRVARREKIETQAELTAIRATQQAILKKLAPSVEFDEHGRIIGPQKRHATKPLSYYVPYIGAVAALLSYPLFGPPTHYLVTPLFSLGSVLFATTCFAWLMAWRWSRKTAWLAAFARYERAILHHVEQTQ